MFLAGFLKKKKIKKIFPYPLVSNTIIKKNCVRVFLICVRVIFFLKYRKKVNEINKNWIFH